MTEHTTESIENEGVTSELSRSECCRLLAAERRRTALVVLGERTAPVDLEDLAREVAARERDGVEAGREATERAALALHHNHLPKMSDLGVLEYDPEANRVESCPRPVDFQIE